MSSYARKGPEYKTISTIMVILLAGKVMGVLRDRLHGVLLGVDTAEGIAFMQASLLPRTFLDIMFASVFSASFIPVFNTYLETKGKKEALTLASSFITVTIALTTVFTLICILLTQPIYMVFLSGQALTQETIDLGVNLLRIMFPLMVLSGAAFSITGVLQSLGQFNIPAAMSIVSNGIILLYYYFLLDRFGVYGLCVAFLLGWAGQTLIQIPFLIKHKFKFRPSFNVRDPGIKQIAALALPVAAASWVGPVNLLVNGKAANVFSGSYDFNAIQYANNLYTIISGVFVLSLANVVFPLFSKQAAVNDDEALSKTLGETLHGLIFFLLPLTIGFMALGEPLVRLVHEGGLFGDEAVYVTSRALFWFSFGIIGYGLQIILTRACYALRDGKTPVVAAIAAIAVNAALSFALAPIIGVAGPTLASSAAITIAAIILLCKLARVGYIKIKASGLVALGKMVCLSVLMLALVLPCRNILANNLPNTVLSRLLHILIPAAIGGGVYLLGSLALKLHIPLIKK